MYKRLLVPYTTITIYVTAQGAMHKIVWTVWNNFPNDQLLKMFVVFLNYLATKELDPHNFWLNPLFMCTNKSTLWTALKYSGYFMYHLLQHSNTLQVFHTVC
jgi:hypothetical protein